MLLIVSGRALADEHSGPYQLDVISVYDGDTFKANVKIWPNLNSIVSVRVNGVDTPEMKGKCPYERELAIKSRNAAENFLSQGKITLHNVKTGKYAGRIIADVKFGQIFLHTYLIDAGLGRPYNGGKRISWCQQ